MSFRITGLDAKPFRHLYGLSDSELAQRGAVRYVADDKPGYPDRVEMRDVETGESVLLVNYEHQPVDGPYCSSHAIYVRKGAEVAYDRVDEVPQCMRVRPLSLRAFDDRGMMVDADLVEGDGIEKLIDRMFENPTVAYIHAHNARRGCYAARPSLARAESWLRRQLRRLWAIDHLPCTIARAMPNSSGCSVWLRVYRRTFRRAR